MFKLSFPRLRTQNVSTYERVINILLERKTEQLLVRVSYRDLQIIKNNAKAVDKTVPAFLRDLGVNFCVLKWEYQTIINHAHEILATKNAINQLVYSIRKTGEYVPADLEYIILKLDEIAKSEKQFVERMLVDQEQKTKNVARSARRIIRQHLASKDMKKKSKT